MSVCQVYAEGQTTKIGLAAELAVQARLALWGITLR